MRPGSLFTLFCLVMLGAISKPSGFTLQSDLLDSRYPQMEAWSRAGVDHTKLTATARSHVISLQPSDDLISAARVPHSQIQLSAGTYSLTQSLRLADGVVIRGAGIGRTRLIVTPGDNSSSKESRFAHTGIIFDAVQTAGLENMTIMMDEAMLSIEPSDNDHPTGQRDSQISLVRFHNSRHSWLLDCELRQARNIPLIIENSSHISIESTRIEGIRDKSNQQGAVIISGSDYCLFNWVEIYDINHFGIRSGTDGRPSHHNVITQSRFNIDVRFLGESVHDNLLQNCVIEVPSWHHSPPIAHHIANEIEVKRNNLIFLCTITRDFPTGNRRFSIAGNPNAVYRLVANTTHTSEVTEVDTAPHSNTLWPISSK